MDAMIVPGFPTPTARRDGPAGEQHARRIRGAGRTAEEALSADCATDQEGSDWVREWYRQIFGIELGGDTAGGGGCAKGPVAVRSQGVWGIDRAG